MAVLSLSLLYILFLDGVILKRSLPVNMFETPLTNQPLFKVGRHKSAVLKMPADVVLHLELVKGILGLNGLYLCLVIEVDKYALSSKVLNFLVNRILSSFKTNTEFISEFEPNLRNGKV